MNLEIILNIILILAIAVGIGFVWRLQQTLTTLNKNRDKMEKFLGDFSGAITRAQQAIRELQDTARNTGIDVEDHLARAQGLRDELSFLVEAADKIATRLTDSASVAQSDAKIARQNRPERNHEPSMAEVRKPISPAEKPAKIVAEPPAPPRIEQVPVSPEPTTKTVPTWVKRAEQNAPIINAPVETPAPVSGLQFGGKKPAQKLQENMQAPAAEAAKDQPKSAAERELLQALEKMK